MDTLTEKIKSLGKILLVMYGATAILLFLLAVMVQKLGMENGTISIGICAVYVISCFLGGFLAGKVQQTKKFIWGLLLGLLYVIIMLAVTLAVKHGFHTSASAFAVNLSLCTGAGMLGGMIS